MNNFSHIPVLLSEAIEYLQISKKGKYIDATLGGGGHTREIIKREGLVLGIDQDADALEFVKQNQIAIIKEQKLIVLQGNFKEISKLASENGFEKADGILFDLGVSSFQLDQSGRGFSLRRDEALDMRMDKTTGLNAYDVINKYNRDQLINIFYTYGEEHNAKLIANKIIDERKRGPIQTTQQLAKIIEHVPHKNESIHPATRIFQAIRIEVNDEISSLKTGLDDSLGLLKDNGRLVVISFHSLEDRIVKQTFLKFERDGKGKVITKKPIVPTDLEIVKNKRSRSAKMRVFERNYA